MKQLNKNNLICTVLIGLWSILPVYSQKKDSTNKVAFDSLTKVFKQIKKDSSQKKEAKNKSSFHFFKDVFGKIDSSKTKKIPKIVLFRSLVLPGWGQATNKQYWLLPIILSAAYATTYGIDGQSFFMGIRPFNKRYNQFVGYLETAIQTKGTVAVTLSDGTSRTLTQDQILTYVNFYRRNRDLTYIGLILGWGLQVVQANVQGHLRTFDVSNNISLNFNPDIQFTPYGSAFGLAARFTIK